MNKNASKSTSTIKTGSIYELKWTPSIRTGISAGIPAAFSHVRGNIVPMILVANASGMDTSHATLLLQCSILGAGVATLLRVFPIRFGNIPIRIRAACHDGTDIHFLPSAFRSVNYGLGFYLGKAYRRSCVHCYRFWPSKNSGDFSRQVTEPSSASIGISCFPIAAYNPRGADRVTRSIGDSSTILSSV